MSSEIGLENFIDTIKNYPDIKHYIFIDGDQFIRYFDLTWIFNKNTDINLLFFITKHKHNNSKYLKNAFNLNKMFHITTSSRKDAADFCISAQMYMVYTYNKIYNINNITYTIVTNDHFAVNIKFDFDKMGQCVNIIDQKTDRIDLCIISLINEDFLSDEAVEIKSLIDNKDFTTIKNIKNIDINSINKEIERSKNIENISILVRNNIPTDISLLIIRNYLKDQYFYNIDEIFENGGLFLSKLGNIYPLREEDKKILKIKSWHALFITYKYLTEKEINISINDQHNKIMYKIHEDLNHIAIDDFTIDQLIKYWLYNWNGSIYDFSLDYKIDCRVFPSWISGKKINDVNCSLAVKQYIINHRNK
jgi:hypothetical protein